jgi:hypothetical protein
VAPGDPAGGVGCCAFAPIADTKSAAAVIKGAGSMGHRGDSLSQKQDEPDPIVALSTAVGIRFTYPLSVGRSLEPWFRSGHVPARQRQ